MDGLPVSGSDDTIIARGKNIFVKGGFDIFVYKAGDVTFAGDDGKIIIKGGTSKYIPIYYGEGNKNIVQKYIPRS